MLVWQYAWGSIHTHPDFFGHLLFTCLYLFSHHSAAMVSECGHIVIFTCLVQGYKFSEEWVCTYREIGCFDIFWVFLDVGPNLCNLMWWTFYVFPCFMCSFFICCQVSQFGFIVVSTYSQHSVFDNGGCLFLYQNVNMGETSFLPFHREHMTPSQSEKASFCKGFYHLFYL